MTTCTVAWNAAQYVKFVDERTRPAMELLSRIKISRPTKIYDLGCGPGNSTVILKDKWPQANVVGVDYSRAMLDTARREHPHIEFVLHDISTWSPASPADLIFSNACYHWIPGHEELLPRLASQLRPGGVLALQMPNNHEKPTHKIMRAIASEHNWSTDLTRVDQVRPLLAPKTYYDLLSPYTSEIDIWETEYFHALDSFDAVVEWLKGSSLRPFIEPLTEREREHFVRLYTDELRAHFKPQANGKVLLLLPRLFVVARRRF